MSERAIKGGRAQKRAQAPYISSHQPTQGRISVC